MISAQFRHITDNPKFALFDLVCVFVACGLWYGQPQLAWWPLIIALTPAIIRLLSKNPFIQRTPFDIAIVIFLLTAVVGVWAAYDREAGWAKFWIIVSAVLLYYALAGQPRINLWLIVGFWVFIGLSIAIYFLLTHDFLINPAKVEILNQLGLWWMSKRPLIRVQGIPPNDMGGMMAMMTPFLLALGLHAWRKKQIFLVILVILGCILILIGLLLTTSRGAWIALSAGMGIWLIWGLSGFVAKKSRWKQVQVFITSCLVLGSITLLFIYVLPVATLDIFEKFPGSASAENRLELARQTIELISDVPFTGGGLRSFPGLYSQYILSIPFFYLIDSHNVYFDVALEQGFIGIAALLVIYIGTFWILLAHSFQSESELADKDLLRWAILTSLLILCLHGLVEDIVYGDLGSPLVFFHAGMAVSLARTDPRLGTLNFPTTMQPSARFSRPRSLWLITVSAIGLIALFTMTWNPSRSKWYANLGSIEMARAELGEWPTGKWDDGSNVSALQPAKRLFHQALSFNPNNRTANHRLGLIAMLNRDYPTAIKYLDSAYHNDNTHQGIQKSLGYSYLWTGQYDQAITFLSEFPDSEYEVGNYIGWWDTIGRSDLSAFAQVMVNRLKSPDLPVSGDNPSP